MLLIKLMALVSLAFAALGGVFWMMTEGIRWLLFAMEDYPVHCILVAGIIFAVYEHCRYCALVRAGRYFR